MSLLFCFWGTFSLSFAALLAEFGNKQTKKIYAPRQCNIRALVDFSGFDPLKSMRFCRLKASKNAWGKNSCFSPKPLLALLNAFARLRRECGASRSSSRLRRECLRRQRTFF